MREYSALTHAALAPGARIAQPAPPDRVDVDDPAFAVMTDLAAVSAATTHADEFSDQAHAQMIERGVRLLFVLDRESRVAGVLTAGDLLGEKPMRFAQSHGVARNEIRVGDLMTPAGELEAVSLQEVSQMRVGHVVATLKAVGRQHLLVAEDDGRRVRGIFSASQVARQLGVQLQTDEVASTFADIEAALVR
jgi:CBS-domain-containing membrane protein